jgi:hemerythrin superfamily protein
MSRTKHRRKVETATWPPICCGQRTSVEIIKTVAHHIEEEEGEMFEKVRELFNDEALEQLGKELQMARVNNIAQQVKCAYRKREKM